MNYYANEMSCEINLQVYDVCLTSVWCVFIVGVYLSRASIGGGLGGTRPPTFQRGGTA